MNTYVYQVVRNLKIKIGTLEDLTIHTTLGPPFSTREKAEKFLGTQSKLLTVSRKSPTYIIKVKVE